MFFGEQQLSPKATDSLYYAVNPHTFENYRDGYLDLWSRMVVSKRAEAQHQIDLILKHQDVYKDIEAASGVPWPIIALIHLREAGPQDVGRWLCVLHNGEKIIGTGRKTTLVPKNLGPFKTFKEAALDALKREFIHVLDWKKDGVARAAFAFETMNGFGYRAHGIPSPYLWGGSSVQKRGKYVRDGVYDASTMDPQIGAMALLKVLMEDTGYSFDGADHQAPPSPPAAPQPAPSKPVEQPKKAPAPVSVDPQRQVGGLLNALYSFIQAFLKRKS